MNDQEWPRVTLDRDYVSLRSYIRVQNPGLGGRTISVEQLAKVMSDDEAWNGLVALIQKVSA